MNHNVNGHELLKALASGYVLRALEPEEVDAFKRHLTTSRECVREVSELRTVVDTLPEIAAPLAPPAALRTRVLEGVTRDSLHLQPPTHPKRAVRRRWAWSRPPAWRAPGRKIAVGLVAVLAVALSVTGTMAYRANGHTSQIQARLAESYAALRIMAHADARWTVAGNAEAPRTSGTFAYSRQKNASSMVLWGLPTEPGKTYMAWTLTDGERVPAGAM